MMMMMTVMLSMKIMMKMRMVMMMLGMMRIMIDRCMHDTVDEKGANHYNDSGDVDNGDKSFRNTYH